MIMTTCNPVGCLAFRHVIKPFKDSVLDILSLRISVEVKNQLKVEWHVGAYSPVIWITIVAHRVVS